MLGVSPETLPLLTDSAGKPCEHGVFIDENILVAGLPIQNGLSDRVHRDLVAPLEGCYDVWACAIGYTRNFTYSLESYPIGTPLVLGFPKSSFAIRLGIVMGVLPLAEFGATGYALATYRDAPKDIVNNPRTIGMIFGAT